MQCKDMQKQLDVIGRSLDQLDKEIEIAEKGLKYSRSSKIKSVLKKARSVLSRAGKALNQGSIPIDLCVELEKAFDEAQSAFQKEMNALRSHCDSLKWDGDSEAKEKCEKEFRKSNYLKAIEKTGDTFENGLKRFIWEKLPTELFNSLKKGKDVVSKAKKELAE